MAKQHTKEFKQEAMPVALTSSLNRKQVTADFGIGFFYSCSVDPTGETNITRANSPI